MYAIRSYYEWLLDGMPKAVRKSVGGIKELAAELARRHTPFEGPMLEVLSRSIQEKTGVRVPTDALRPEELVITSYSIHYTKLYDDPGIVHVIDKNLALLRPLGIEAVGHREFPLPPSPGSVARVGYLTNQPRTFGVTARFKF